MTDDLVSPIHSLDAFDDPDGRPLIVSVSCDLSPHVVAADGRISGCVLPSCTDHFNGAVETGYTSRGYETWWMLVLMEVAHSTIDYSPGSGVWWAERKRDNSNEVLKVVVSWPGPMPEGAPW